MRLMGFNFEGSKITDRPRNARRKTVFLFGQCPSNMLKNLQEKIHGIFLNAYGLVEETWAKQCPKMSKR